MRYLNQLRHLSYIQQCLWIVHKYNVFANPLSKNVDLDPYSSDDKVVYISLDELIETEVLTAQSNQSKPSQGCSKEPVKTILRC